MTAPVWAVGIAWGLSGLIAVAALEQKRLWWVALWLGPVAFPLLGPLPLREKRTSAIGTLRTLRKLVRSQLPFFRDATRSLLVLLTTIGIAVGLNATASRSFPSTVAEHVPEPPVVQPVPEPPVTAPAAQPPRTADKLGPSFSGPSPGLRQPLDFRSWDNGLPSAETGKRFAASDRDSYDFGPWSRQAVAAHQRGDYATAIESYRQALRSGESHEIARNNLAWILATCPDDACRDGPGARKIVEEMVQAAGQPLRFRWNQYGTAAAACAATGEFEEAVRWQRLSVATSPPQYRSQQEERLQLYTAGQTFREASAENVVMGPLPPLPATVSLP